MEQNSPHKRGFCAPFHQYSFNLRARRASVLAVQFPVFHHFIMRIFPHLFLQIVSSKWLRVLVVGATLSNVTQAQHAYAQTAPGIVSNATPKPKTPAATPAFSPTPKPIPTPLPAPPLAQSYVVSKPGVVVSYGRTMVPATFLSDSLGASVGSVAPGRWRILYFGKQIDLFAYQLGAIFDGQNVTLPVQPQIIDGKLFVPWVPIAQHLGIGWQRVQTPTSSTRSDAKPKTQGATREAQTTFLLQYPAAYIENVRATKYEDRTRVVLTLSNPTRIVANQNGVQTSLYLSGARRNDVPATLPIGDYLVPRAVTTSGNWRAKFEVKTNYVAPVRWFTLGSPNRIVIDFQKLFEESKSDNLGGGLTLTKTRKGTSHGPVQMFVVRVDPRQGWRLRVAPGGYRVLQRSRTSRIAKDYKALVAVNGGFFAPDGAAVGALVVNHEWLRLPWRARTAIAFMPDGRARIGNLQAFATARFSTGLTLPVRDLNGWPDNGKLTALTHRFGNYYLLRAGEIAVVVKGGIIVAKPGGGGVPIHRDGFTLVASGAARTYLESVARGGGAELQISAPGWNEYSDALGGGPRLVENGRINVTDLREAFRADVRVGLGPRTALGIDKYGRYIMVVVDGRQGFYSTGLTLTELAATMQKLGAVNALNLDGGGSTAMSVRNRVVNRPSDGVERGVSNALLVMR